MVLSDLEIQSRITSFKASVAADLYTSRDLIDLNEVDTALTSYSFELAALQQRVANDEINVGFLTELLISYPRIYGVLTSFLSVNSGVELEDGRKLPSSVSPPKDVLSARSAATILLELGLGVVLRPTADVLSLFVMHVIAADVPKRRFRLEARLQSRMDHLILATISEVGKRTGRLIELVAKSALPSAARRIADYALSVDGRVAFGIATTFQAYSGGRQAREFSVLYPNIASTLRTSDVLLVLIADGPGVRGLSERVLRELFKAVPQTMTISQAEAGTLAETIAEEILAPRLPNIDEAGISTLINRALEEGGEAHSGMLPLQPESARMALANFTIKNRHLALRLSSNASTLEWANTTLVKKFREVKRQFDPSSAINGFVELLGASEIKDPGILNFWSRIIALEEDPVFPQKFLVAASASRPEPSILRETARHALQNAPDSRVAILITLETVSGKALQEVRDVQAFLPVTVVVVDVNLCLQMAESREVPRDRLRSLMLEQTDLTKLSPFVVRGVTPSRVFFGREVEEATLLSTLATNSVALLGGRRIGKTSLMRHSFGRLKAANIRPFFGDCQVVRTWADFGQMAAREWGVNVVENFRPNNLFDIVAQLGEGSNSPIVLLLDEIDQLLDWDKSHNDNEVPEAFFRACRAISQQGLAQFVFSGERTIANRLWDPSSPHWNFCRPLMLQQLRESEAHSLITEPLEALGIRIEGESEFLQAAWETTDGHPELMQFIGDKIVSLVNERDRNEVHTTPEDILAVTGQYEYAEQYLETYWGQATPLERIVSVILIDGAKSIEQLVQQIKLITGKSEANQIQSALRMLELYGIARQHNAGYELRLAWFVTALGWYGGPSMIVNRYLEEVML